MKTEKTPLSVAIVTMNEEIRLPDCLESVSFAEDIVVVDSHSTDKTVEIAKSFACRIFIEDWKLDAPQKNSAVDKTKYDWVLIMDADEIIPDETKNEIIRIIENPKSVDAYSFPRKNFFHGRWIRHADWWPDYTIRLVKKSKGIFNTNNLVHPEWVTTGQVVTLEYPIEHYSFRNYADMLHRLNKRSDEMAMELYRSGERANIWSPLIHGISMFFKIYFLRLGFWEGFDGLVIALTRAGGTFFKYAKLLELQNSQK